jgi:hypothetical protein
VSFTAANWSSTAPAAPDAAAPSGPDSMEGIHIDDLLMEAVERGASDLHLSDTLPPVIRIDGKLVRLGYDPLRGAEIQRLVYEILTVPLEPQCGPSRPVSPLPRSCVFR